MSGMAVQEKGPRVWVSGIIYPIPEPKSKMLGYRVSGMGIYFSEYNTNSYKFWRYLWVLSAHFDDLLRQRSKGGSSDLELEI